MYSVMEKRFAAALKNGSLVYWSAGLHKDEFNGIKILYTLAPALAKKPSKDDVDSQSTGEPESVSPWLPPEEDLVVEKQEHYTVVLNKFAIMPYHFLLVTNEFEKQTAPLSPRDLGAAFDLLRRANTESGKRHLGFYNSGPNSGASIPHRHIQFVPVPAWVQLFPDRTPRPTKANTPASDPRVPFSHFIAYLVEDSEEEDLAQYDEEDLAQAYMLALSRAITVCGREGVPLSYNLVFTEEWIMATPRSQEKIDGISINSLGTVGMILVKSEQQLDYAKELGLTIIEKLGFPNVPEAEGAGEADDGYIKY